MNRLANKVSEGCMWLFALMGVAAATGALFTMGFFYGDHIEPQQTETMLLFFYNLFLYSSVPLAISFTFFLAEFLKNAYLVVSSTIKMLMEMWRR